MFFFDELKQYQDIIENELQKHINKNSCPEQKLNKSIAYSLISTGKRIRPILMLATYKLFKEDITECLPFCVAIEMIHNFSLIHDDLPAIDNDYYRHGKLTNHREFGEATAILAGDSLLNNAYLVISDELKNLNNIENKVKAFNELTYATKQMIIGEYVDIEFEGKEISIKYLEYMHKNKTGALIRASVRIGAILAGANEAQLEHLTNYAEKIGLAFQIKDDILAEEGNEEIMGKPVGNDKANNKCTYVTKYGLPFSKNILDLLIEEAKDELKNFNNNKFLQEMAMYIKNRNK